MPKMEQLANRFITADRIHDGYKFLERGAIIELTNDGIVVAIHSSYPGEAERFEGMLVPGFVNAHCHLELSHMQGLIPKGTGLIPFLSNIPGQRDNFTEEQKKAARHEAFEVMRANGVVAVGDIANSTDTLDLRALGRMHVHTFVECIGFTEQFAQPRLDFCAEQYHQFAAQERQEVVLRESIIPHAPYSVSAPLFKLINRFQQQSLISIHNQESRAEDEFYRSKTGDVRTLLSGLGVDDNAFQPSGKSSLQTYLPHFSPEHSLLLVHNTYTSKEDVRFAESSYPSISWCLCPNANLYIENALPDVMMLKEEAKNICIGTDSLASNDQLSVFAELQTLKRNFEKLEWETLIRWGTSNGAKALKMDDVVGSFEIGKKPGVVCIQNVDDDTVLVSVSS